MLCNAIQNFYEQAQYLDDIFDNIYLDLCYAVYILSRKCWIGMYILCTAFILWNIENSLFYKRSTSSNLTATEEFYFTLLFCILRNKSK